MARQLRHNIENGWVHITTRGVGRRKIFADDRDREHLVELFSGMVERYEIILHAFVLMDNHYHLLIQTPRANASRALQWLNVSYAAWFNAKHNRAGALFQQRYKSIPVDGEGSWALACSIYIHLNPVRITSLGLGKDARKRELKGCNETPTRQQVSARLAVLRGYRWSSYLAYAGYSARPEWLTCENICRRAGNAHDQGKQPYRKSVEEALKQGIEEGGYTRMTAALAIGCASFVDALRQKIPSTLRSETNARAWHRLLPVERIIKAVEAVKGEAWDIFSVRRGDCGRDIALHLARLHCGCTLAELGQAFDMNVAAVSKATDRVGKRIKTDKKVMVVFRKVSSQL